MCPDGCDCHCNVSRCDRPELRISSERQLFASICRQCWAGIAVFWCLESGLFEVCRVCVRRCTDCESAPTPRAGPVLPCFKRHVAALSAWVGLRPCPDPFMQHHPATWRRPIVQKQTPASLTGRKEDEGTQKKNVNLVSGFLRLTLLQRAKLCRRAHARVCQQPRCGVKRHHLPVWIIETMVNKGKRDS